MVQDDLNRTEVDDIHRETDPDDLAYGGVAVWVQSLKQELFDDLTADDVCYVTGLDKSTVLKYLRDGTIAGYQLGRTWRVPPDSLRKFKEHLLNEARAAAADARLERECEVLRSTEPDKGWATERCPRTGHLILVEDEVEKDLAAEENAIHRWFKTGRKTGYCEFCSHSCAGDLVPVHHQFEPF